MLEINIGDLADLIGGRLRLGRLPPRDGAWTQLKRSSIDWRTVGAGEAYWHVAREPDEVAVPPDAAYGRGALGVIAAREIEPWAGCWSILVDDPRQALCRLARESRLQWEGLLMLGWATPGGPTPLDLLKNAGFPLHRESVSSELSCAKGLMELDCAAPLIGLAAERQEKTEIERISHLCGPYAVCITRTHNAHHFSPADRQTAKEILKTLPEDGWAVLSGDDPRLRGVEDGCQARCIRVGLGPGCDIRAEDFQPPVPSTSNVESVLAAYALGRNLGAPQKQLDRILSQPNNDAPSPGRQAG